MPDCGAVSPNRPRRANEGNLNYPASLREGLPSSLFRRASTFAPWATADRMPDRMPDEMPDRQMGTQVPQIQPPNKRTTRTVIIHGATAECCRGNWRLMDENDGGRRKWSSKV